MSDIFKGFTFTIVAIFVVFIVFAFVQIWPIFGITADVVDFFTYSDKEKFTDLQDEKRRIKLLEDRYHKKIIESDGGVFRFEGDEFSFIDDNYRYSEFLYVLDILHREKLNKLFNRPVEVIFGKNVYSSKTNIFDVNVNQHEKFDIMTENLKKYTTTRILEMGYIDKVRCDFYIWVDEFDGDVLDKKLIRTTQMLKDLSGERDIEIVYNLYKHGEIEILNFEKLQKLDRLPSEIQDLFETVSIFLSNDEIGTIANGGQVNFWKDEHIIGAYYTTPEENNISRKFNEWAEVLGNQLSSKQLESIIPGSKMSELDNAIKSYIYNKYGLKSNYKVLNSFQMNFEPSKVQYMLQVEMEDEFNTVFMICIDNSQYTIIPVGVLDDYLPRYIECYLSKSVFDLSKYRKKQVQLKLDVNTNGQKPSDFLNAIKNESEKFILLHTNNREYQFIIDDKVQDQLSEKEISEIDSNLSRILEEYSKTGASNDFKCTIYDIRNITILNKNADRLLKAAFGEDFPIEYPAWFDMSQCIKKEFGPRDLFNTYMGVLKK